MCYTEKSSKITHGLFFDLFEDGYRAVPVIIPSFLTGATGSINALYNSRIGFLNKSQYIACRKQGLMFQ